MVVLMISVSVCGQKDKYTFAQTYIGAQTNTLGGLNSPEYMAGRFLIGGTHFWQKADFYISIPLFTSFDRGQARRLSYELFILS